MCVCVFVWMVLFDGLLFHFHKNITEHQFYWLYVVVFTALDYINQGNPDLQGIPFHEAWIGLFFPSILICQFWVTLSPLPNYS